MPNGNEYEYVAYPKLNHVKVGFVEITSRNPHAHRELEMGIVLDGQGLLSTGGDSFELRRGSLYFINANEAHDLLSTGPEALRLAFLQVSNRFCQDYLHLFRNLELLQSDLTGFLDPEDSRELSRLLVSVLRCYLEEGDLCLLHTMNAICQLFSALLERVPYQRFAESQYQAKKRKTARLQRVADYIGSHYSERISLGELARREGVSDTHMSHFIRENMGISFQEYVNNLRLERAVQLILSETMSLTDICMECGFSDVKYMNRMFQRRFGCMPREFSRARLAGEVQKSRAGERQKYASEQEGLGWLEEYEKTDC